MFCLYSKIYLCLSEPNSNTFGHNLCYIQIRSPKRYGDKKRAMSNPTITNPVGKYAVTGRMEITFAGLVCFESCFNLQIIMSKPKILLLDEPSLGLSPKLVKEIFGILNRLNKDQGVTILLVEQNAKAALDIADFGYVMELGRIVLDGKSSDLSEAKDIQEFYLGANQESQLGQKRWKNRKTWR